VSFLHLSASWRTLLSPGRESHGSPGALVWRVPVSFASPAGVIPTDWVIDARTGEILAAQYDWFDFDGTGIAPGARR